MKVGLIKEKLDGYVKRGEDGGVNWGKGGNERKFDIMSHGWCWWGGWRRTSMSLKTDIC